MNCVANLEIGCLVIRLHSLSFLLVHLAEVIDLGTEFLSLSLHRLGVGLGRICRPLVVFSDGGIGLSLSLLYDLGGFLTCFCKYLSLLVRKLGILHLCTLLKLFCVLLEPCDISLVLLDLPLASLKICDQRLKVYRIAVDICLCTLDDALVDSKFLRYGKSI